MRHNYFTKKNENKFKRKFKYSHAFLFLHKIIHHYRPVLVCHVLEQKRLKFALSCELKWYSRNCVFMDFVVIDFYKFVLQNKNKTLLSKI